MPHWEEKDQVPAVFWWKPDLVGEEILKVHCDSLQHFACATARFAARCVSHNSESKRFASSNIQSPKILENLPRPVSTLRKVLVSRCD